MENRKLVEKLKEKCVGIVREMKDLKEEHQGDREDLLESIRT